MRPPAVAAAALLCTTAAVGVVLFLGQQQGPDARELEMASRTGASAERRLQQTASQKWAPIKRKKLKVTPLPQPDCSSGGYEAAAQTCKRWMSSWAQPRKAHRRYIFLDFGANYASTLRLYKDIGCMPDCGIPWEVYAFEASPTIWPHLDKMARHLNGQGERPQLVAPGFGSGEDLENFARVFGCREGRPVRGELDKLRRCMNENGMNQQIQNLRAIPLNPAFNTSEMVAERLAEAAVSNAGNKRARYTFVPAAVGATDGWLQAPCGSDVGSVMTSIRINAKRPNDKKPSATCVWHRIRTVDVASWIKKHFTDDDWIVMKMDTEGGEYGVFNAMLKDMDGLGKLIDVLGWECHSSPQHKQDCGQLRPAMEAAGFAKYFRYGPVAGGMYPDRDSTAMFELRTIDLPHLEEITDEWRAKQSAAS